MTLWLPLAPRGVPSLNQVLRWGWKKRWNYDRKIHELVKVRLLLAGTAPTQAPQWPIRASKVKLLSRRPRRLDPDNLYLKPFLDGLVKAGVLADDSAKDLKALEIIQRGIEDALGPGLEVWIWDAASSTTPSEEIGSFKSSDGKPVN